MSGHVEKQGPSTWVAVYSNPANKSGRGSRSFRRKIDAQRFLAITETAQLKREWVDPGAGRVTVRAYAEGWVKARAIRETTRERYYYYLKHIDVVGDYHLNALTPTIVEQWQAKILADHQTSTTEAVRGMFSAILKSAVRDQLIVANPFIDVATVRTEKTLVIPMEMATVLAIRDTINKSLRAAVLVGAGCGLRRGECMGLTVDRVDFLRRTITVDRQLVEVYRQEPTLGPPKSRASVRQVPAPQVVLDALAAHLAASPPNPPGEVGLIFHAPRGGPATRAKVNDAWRRNTAAPAGSRFHDLRHFYASTLIRDGASVPEVQARLGHASPMETLGTYAHLWPNNEDNTRRIIDAAFAPKAVERDEGIEQA